jgi:hypothetical protein
MSVSQRALGAHRCRGPGREVRAGSVWFPGQHARQEAGAVRGQASGRGATLGEMRSLGLDSLDIICTACGHHATFKADKWPDELPMRACGPHVECKKCGHRGASVRSDWTQLRKVRKVATAMTRSGAIFHRVFFLSATSRTDGRLKPVFYAPRSIPALPSMPLRRVVVTLSTWPWQSAPGPFASATLARGKGRRDRVRDLGSPSRP